MRTVNVQLVYLRLYIFCGLGTFKKVAADYLDHVGVTKVQHRRKAFSVHLSSLPIGLIKRVLVVFAEGSRFTSLSKLFQFI